MPQPNTVIRVEIPEFSSLLLDIKEFPDDLAKNLRRNIRIVGKKAADAAKAKVLEDPPKGGGGHGSFINVKKHKGLEHSIGTRGLRASIAAGIAVDIKTGKSAKSESGVYIRAHSSQLGDAASLVRRYNAAKGFAHPVFGDKAVWAHQTGRPYFGSVLSKFKPELKAAVEDALNTAAAALGRSRHT